MLVEQLRQSSCLDGTHQEAERRSMRGSGRWKRSEEGEEVEGETEKEQNKEEDVGVNRSKSSSRGQWYCCSPEAVVSLQHIHDSATGRSQHLVHGEERGVTTLPIMGCYAGVLHTQVLKKEEEGEAGKILGIAAVEAEGVARKEEVSQRAQGCNDIMMRGWGLHVCRQRLAGSVLPGSPAADHGRGC